MKLNEHEAILTSRLLLVPYSTHHVPTYHEWMQDEEIQKATASDPLSLPEEHAMQQSWRLDHDKLTFIICSAPPPSTNASPTTLIPQEHDTPSTMLGDVNLFLYEDPDLPSSTTTPSTDPTDSVPIIGELEIMLPLPSSRRQGLATSALKAFVAYITSPTNLPRIMEEYRLGCDERSERFLRYLRVKIDKENEASLGLFGKLGFARVGEVNYFGEVEMRREVREGGMTDGLAEGEVGTVVGYVK
ncbi:GNAT domain-containing protein [Phaeosphaeria sp. MPI-PUGE-AT-0046c]|nr:GNAT domain-containing protein [Phaeosphaeria sp. MPI-PUGE-AT-0046c]